MSEIVLDYRIEAINPEHTVWGIYRRFCGSSDFYQNYTSIDPNTLKIDNSIHCPTPDTKKQTCTLTISHEGQVLFTKSGDCPIDYSVSCDGGCPDGYVKCDSSNYPGYCCIPCSEIKGSIGSLISLVRSK